MKPRLGNFDIIEQIDPGGYTIVYRAKEQMGHGVTRPAAIKILQGWKHEDPEQVAALRREVGVLAELSACPNIVTIYAFDIDPEIGPWIAMELGGKSVRHAQTDEPADPNVVRQLLRDILRALTAMHGAKPMVLHRDLKPNNILSTGIGTWKLADFGLAKRSESESTLNVLTVQYAAPELLDGSIGKEGPWTDLYSLGLVAYELALGRKLYKAQFPSVFDPFAGPDATRVDERPKWMYWHTSQQMTLKPLAELLPGFPKDLSDLVASMVLKAPTERVQSASDALARLKEASDVPAPRVALPAAYAREESRAARASNNNVLLAAVTLAALAVVLLLGGWLYTTIGSRPSVTFANKGKFSGDGALVAVSGQVRNMSARASAAIVTSDGTRVPVNPDASGKFSVDVRLPKLGESSARFRLSEGTVRLIEQPITLERVAPKVVRVVVTTNPPARDVELTFQPSGGDAKPIVVRTSERGLAEAVVPYGRFEVRLSHPRYTPGSRQYETGADASKTITANLVPLTDSAIADARRAFLSAVESTASLASAGDSDAIMALERTLGDLTLLEGEQPDDEARRRLSIVQEMIDVAKRAAAGDARAGTRLADLRAEVEDMVRGAKTAGGSERRQAIMRELTDAVERSLKGETSAIDRLGSLRVEIAELDAQENAGISEAAQRVRLLNEMYELAGRASRGDSSASVALRGSLRQFEALPVPLPEGGPSNRRKLLMDAVASATRSAAGGNPEAVGEIRRAREALVDLDKQDRIAAPVASRRARLLTDLVNLAESAARGDVQSALRLRQVEQELFAIDTPGVRLSVFAGRDSETLNRRATLVREMGDVASDVSRNPAALDKLRKIRTELQALEVAEGTASESTPLGRRRSELLTELSEVTELAAGGSLRAQERLDMIRRELAILVAIDQSGGNAEQFGETAFAILGSAPSLSLIDRGTLLQLPDDQFAAYVENVIPRGALSVEVVPNLRRLRLRGILLTEREFEILSGRLEPAMPRLMLETRIDAWAVARRLEERLRKQGYESVRVHPYLGKEQTTLYVQASIGEQGSIEMLERAARDCVLDHDIVVVQRAPKAATPAPSPGG